MMAIHVYFQEQNGSELTDLNYEEPLQIKKYLKLCHGAQPSEVPTDILSL